MRRRRRRRRRGRRRRDRSVSARPLSVGPALTWRSNEEGREGEVQLRLTRRRSGRRRRQRDRSVTLLRPPLPLGRGGGVGGLLLLPLPLPLLDSLAAPHSPQRRMRGLRGEAEEQQRRGHGGGRGGRRATRLLSCSAAVATTLRGAVMCEVHMALHSTTGQCYTTALLPLYGTWNAPSLSAALQARLTGRVHRSR